MTTRTLKQTLAQYIRLMQGKEGFYPASNEPETALFIEALIKLNKPKNIVEIGTHMGFTTLHMIRGSIGIGPEISTVDIEDKRSPFLDEFKGLYKFFEMDSLDFLKRESGIDFIFIDGNHDPYHVNSELWLLEPRLSKRSTVLIHDTILFEELGRFARAFAYKNGFQNMLFRTPKSSGKKCESTGLTVLYRD